MDQHHQELDKSNSPSTSYHETFRRHRMLLCMPIILGGLAAAFFLFATGKTYESTTSSGRTAGGLRASDPEQAIDDEAIRDIGRRDLVAG